MRIAIIPARGGSKRIPKKNIKDFAGKPMIAYAISAARKSGLFHRIIVSTDDRQIAAKAEEWGAEIPFLRPEDLSDDFTPTVPVIAHAVKESGVRNGDADYVCCIYPTVPFLEVEDLVQAFQMLQEKEAEFCLTVTEFPSSIHRALKRDQYGNLQPFQPEYELTRTQDLEPAYFDAGQFYWGKADSWLRHPNIHSQGIGYVIPYWRAVDIDNFDDWKRAELMYNALIHS